MSDLSLLQFIQQGVPEKINAGVAVTIATQDDLLAMLPFARVDSDEYKYVREKALPSFGWKAPGGSFTDDTAAQDSTARAYLRTLGGNMSFNRLQANRGGGGASIIRRATRKAAKSLGRTIGSALVNGANTPTVTLGAGLAAIGSTVTAVVAGPNYEVTRDNVGELRYTHSTTSWAFRAPGDPDFGAEVIVGTSSSGTLYSSNPDRYVTITRNSTTIGANGVTTLLFSGGTNQFDGLLELALDSQQVSTGTNGEALSLPLLDNMLQSVKSSDQKYLLMPGRTWVAMQALARGAAGGLTFVDLAGKQMPRYNGAIILVSDFIPTTQTKGSTSGSCTTIFAFTMGADGGLLGLYSEAMEPPLPNASPIAKIMPGVEILDLGLAGDADSRKMRATAYVSLAQPSTVQFAWADGITN